MGRISECEELGSSIEQACFAVDYVLGSSSGSVFSGRCRQVSYLLSPLRDAFIMLFDCAAQSLDWLMGSMTSWFC